MKFVITTHNPLFYNVLANEFKNQSTGYKPDKHFRKIYLERYEDSTFSIEERKRDSPFSYHLFLLTEIEKAIQAGTVQKYHFNFLRNILEKVSMGHRTKRIM